VFAERLSELLGRPVLDRSSPLRQGRALVRQSSPQSNSNSVFDWRPRECHRRIWS